MRPLLSVIVPLAPGENEWEGLRAQLIALLAGSEIIVVRPGTANGHDARTMASTSMMTVCEIVTAPGRARQLNAGARAARGRWLWFLHADSRLHPRTLPALHSFLARGEDVLGYFDLRYRDDGPWLARINAIGANFRARCFGLPFGDQGFVLPATSFATLGGYDEAAIYGEDHLLIWRAHAASLPLVRIDAPLFSSARKYAREGWLRTTLRHLVLTLRQAWPQWRRSNDSAQPASPTHVSRDDAPASPTSPHDESALAIFVKTPGHSPIKTRLAAGIGEAHATAFYRVAAEAVAQVARAVHGADCDLRPYWAVAETAALDHRAWMDFPRIAQGGGDLGARLHQVYSSLQARHGRVLLVGADAPQVTPDLLGAALAALDDSATPFVLGEARDGGFWLFGGRVPIPESVWRGVRYSQSTTAAQLRGALAPRGGIAQLPTLTDIDNASDLDALTIALDALSDPLPAQRALRAWLQTLSEIPQPKDLRA